jgi:molybdate transport system substrate-binding protein
MRECARHFRLVFCLVVLVALSTSHAAELSVAAASDLKFALDDIIAEFQQTNADGRIKASYGSSGNFYAQISQRAPYDMFLSADNSYPQRLIETGHGIAESRFTYAVGRIVVWVRTNSALEVRELGIGALKHPSVRKIAIANPEHAPYGKAAVAAMRKLGVYEAVKDRLAYGENIAQTGQFIDSGAADIGIIALSLAVAPAMKDRGRYWEVPPDAYPRMEQGGVILPWTREMKLAGQFRAFILGEAGKAVLRRHGFSMP